MSELQTTAWLWSTPPGVKLARLEVIPDGGARNFVLWIGSGRFHGFVVRRGEALHGYVDRCPHAGLPLAKALDDYLTPTGQHIACGWHGARFDIESGICLSGPCLGQSLMHWPVSADDGLVVTGAPGAAKQSAGAGEQVGDCVAPIGLRASVPVTDGSR
jgi:nitrite reductase/ring-hydroxylating ferredoxin subunit